MSFASLFWAIAAKHVCSANLVRKSFNIAGLQAHLDEFYMEQPYYFCLVHCFGIAPLKEAQ